MSNSSPLATAAPSAMATECPSLPTLTIPNNHTTIQTPNPPSHLNGIALSHPSIHPAENIITRPATKTLTMKGSEIIDLCSDSDSDDEIAPLEPPRKKAKLDAPGSLSVTAANGAGAGIGTAEGIFSGVVWKRADSRGEGHSDGDGDNDMKEESPEPLVVASTRTVEGRIESAAGSGEVVEERQIPMETCEESTGTDLTNRSLEVTGQIQVPYETPQDREELPIGEDELLKQDQALVAAHLGGNGSRVSDHAPKAAILVPSTEDVLEIAIESPGMFMTPHVARSDDIKPVSRLETINTEAGTKQRRIVGPFILEGDDDDEDGNKCTPSRDEGHGSFDTGLKESDRGSRSRTPLPPRSLFSPCNDYVSPNSTAQASDRIGPNEMNLFQRRRQSEDKCAETSRKLREIALSKRKGKIPETQHFGLSEAFLEDSSLPETTSSYSGNLIAKNQHTSQSLSSTSGHNSKGNGFDADDDLFGEESIEAQLDLAQALVSGDGNLPSPKALLRSPTPPTSVASMGKADLAHKLDSQNNDPGLLPHDSISHPEKQLLNGRDVKTVTSGIAHYDMEQAEKYGKKHNNKQREKEQWPEKIEFERLSSSTLPLPITNSTPPSMIDGARSKDEARLLAAKESVKAAKAPLRAAPNINGGLADLVKHSSKKSELSAKIGSPQVVPRASQHSRVPVVPVNHQACDEKTSDEGLWTKNGGPRERKRDLENLMNAFNETAKCCVMAFDALKAATQKQVESEVMKLRSYSDQILRGYTFQTKAGKRLNDIKKNMVRRIRNHQKANGSDGTPSQQEIEQTLIRIMGPERARRGKEMLNDVIVEYEQRKPTYEKRSHRKKDREKPVGDGPNRFNSMTFSYMPDGDVQDFVSESESDSQREEDTRRKSIKQKLAMYEIAPKPTKQDNSDKRVRFADDDLWNSRFDQGQASEMESDENEIAPSFGHGPNGNNALASRTGPMAEVEDPGRRSIGAKGLLTDIRKVSDKTTTSNGLNKQRRIATKRLPSENGQVVPTAEMSVPQPPIRMNVGGKSVPLIEQQSTRVRPVTTNGLSDVESQHDADELDSEAESSQTDVEDVNDEDANDVYGEMYVSQYDIVADYEQFPNQEDAKSVPLGRHVDVKAALRQMGRVTTDIAALASQKYRQVRIIWDTDDFELTTQTIILPTGGECQVRMKKSWAPATNWPGKDGSSAKAPPKVFYVVHETKKTSLRPPAEAGHNGDDDELFGPEDFEDPDAVIEKERDMCFSSRSCANEIAKNRLVAFNNRHSAVEDAAGTASTADLAEYMEQIEHDKKCFEQERRFWIDMKDARKGKEEIKIWVEEMLVDMPHI